MNWAQHVDMQWAKNELKTAVLADPRCLNFSNVEKTCVEAEIEVFLQSMTPKERLSVNTSIILEKLATDTGIHMTPTLTPTNLKRSFWELFSGCGACES